MVEPIVSKHKCNRRVQVSNIKCYPKNIAGGILNCQIHGMSNPCSKEAIEKSEVQCTNRIRGQIEFINEIGVYETMGGTRIY